MDTKNNSSSNEKNDKESCLKSVWLNNLLRKLFGKELISKKNNDDNPIFKSYPDLQINNKIQSEGLELISLFIPSVKSFVDSNFKINSESSSTKEKTLLNYFQCFANKGTYNPNIAKYLKKQLEKDPRAFFLEIENRCRDFLATQETYDEKSLTTYLLEQAEI